MHLSWLSAYINSGEIRSHLHFFTRERIQLASALLRFFFFLPRIISWMTEDSGCHLLKHFYDRRDLHCTGGKAEATKNLGLFRANNFVRMPAT